MITGHGRVIRRLTHGTVFIIDEKSRRVFPFYDDHFRDDPLTIGDQVDYTLDKTGTFIENIRPGR